MSDIITDLRRKEKQIQDLRTRESHRQGQEDTLRTQLKAEFGLETIDAANTQLESINQQITQTGVDLQALNAELERIIQLAVEPSTGGLNGTE